MNIARTTISLVLLAALGTTAQARSPLTREQVRAELAEAVRTGDMLADGDSGLKLNEEFPQRYPAVIAVPGKTRAEVLAELAEAIRTGDIVADDEIGRKLYEAFPQRYAKALASHDGLEPASVAVAASAAARRDEMRARTAAAGITDRASRE